MRILIAVFCITLLALEPLAVCAQTNSHPMDMNAAVRNAKTAADHEALAAHYETVAQEMRTKKEEHKRFFNQYKKNPWLYRRQIQIFQSHCTRLINIYGNAATENMEMAKMHRQMANGIR